jgi:glycosyltransferase involved in cell wall biosynthesis
MVVRWCVFLACGVWLGVRALGKGDVNILVAQSPFEGMVALAVRCVARCRKLQAVVVVEAHGDWEEAPMLYRRIWAPALYHWLLSVSSRYVLRRADVLRAISEFTLEKLTRVSPEKPVIRFPTFTDIDLFLDDVAEPCGPAEQTEILFAGTLAPVKGVDVLILAFEQVAREYPEVTLVLVGEGSAEAELRTLVESRGLDDRVLFRGTVSQPELKQRMLHCVCLVLPSRSEGLGRVLLEAMACGRPVIGSRVGGIPELIHDGVNGFLVEVGDVDSLRDRMGRLLGEPQLAEQLGRNGRRMVRDLFSPDAYFKGYTELVETAERLVAT